jgi:hypothetical protein
MDEVQLKSDVQNGHQMAVFGSFFNVKITLLSLDHHGDNIISPIIFILSEHVRTCLMDPCGLTEIGNSKWPPGSSFSIKTKQICICSAI